MHLFYQPNLQDGLHELSEEETRHAVRVLRLGNGDKIQLTDGKGVSATAEITEISKRSCSFRVISQKAESKPVLPKMALAPTKSIDRFEWFLEKAVEIGVGEICPILCSNSERRIIKQERCEKVVLAALKQSQRNWLPTLRPLTQFNDFIENNESAMFVAHCREAEKIQLTEISESQPWLLIGPEGDFTLEEINLAAKHGAQEIDLGKSRLRTETAGIFALSVMNYLHK